MPGNTDEKEKCLEKLNEMQKFLPFLDFMIDKIKSKNNLPLECQLNKFQHIRSVITDKNGKYGLEGINNIEEVLLKLISKLDYKGIDLNAKKENVERKTEITGVQIKQESVPETPAPATETQDDRPSVPPSKSTVDTMKSATMTVVQSSRQEERKDVKECKVEAGSVECPVGKTKEAETSRKDGDNAPNPAPLDVLASSRKKLLKSVSGKGCPGVEGDTESYKKKTAKPSTDSSKGVAPVEEKGQNSDALLIGELSDISDDEYFGAENVKSDRERSGTRRRSSEASTRREKYKSPNRSMPYQGSDARSKQKLRERLSADIAEMHKVPGKSVGGSLRSLKDLKEEERKKSGEGRSKSREKNDSERDHAKKSSRRERRSKDHRSEDRERRRDDKHHHRSGDEKEDRHKHSGRKKKEEDDDDGDENKLIDTFDDGELIAFVTENMSDLPNLSAMSPEEMRKAVKQSYAIQDETDRKESPQCGERTSSPSVDIEAILNRSDTEEDDDEYSMRLIEELTPKTLESKRPVPETPRENPVENKDPRIRHPANVSEPNGGHPNNDPRIAQMKQLRSPTDSVVPPRVPNDFCDPRMVWNPCSENQPNRQCFPQPRFTICYAVSNNPRYRGVPPRYTRPPSYSEATCYREYKQLKRQENTNRLRLSLDDRLTSREPSTPEAKTEGPIKSPPPAVKPNDGRYKKSGPKMPNPKTGVETHKKPVKGGGHQEERTDKPLSVPDEELVSPLDKLYENDPKPVTGRGYGLQNFKIPRKGRSTSVDQVKAEEKNKASDVRSGPVIGQEREEVSEDKTVPEKKSDSEKVVPQNQDPTPKDDSCDVQTEKVSDPVCVKEKDAGEDKAVSGSLNNEKEVDRSRQNEKSSVEGGKEVKNGKTNTESDVKPNGESDAGSKSTITEEITQELVETLISKSFESGEGELLLAKAKLFKELALKLNSKKLKTIQKIINSESDSSSSSSRSSMESEKKKKKTKKKNSDESEKQSKKPKREKKTFKSKKYVESSSESDGEPSRTRKSKAPTKTEKDDSESEKAGSLSEGESPSKPKKSQRKTKLLEQIFNESPAKDFDLSLDNQNPEKESDQKSKAKVKSKGKTELDRLHEDIRNMFISSGVVTATGQRMCRMLRESGGKMNNLDLVMESAKMVEEEKLANRRSKRLTNARSRSRSMDRNSLRDRSRSRSLVSGHDEETSKVLRDQPVVLLERIDLKKMSYAYKISGFPESHKWRRGRNVARRGRGHGHLTRPTEFDETSLIRKRRIYLMRNLRRCYSERSKTRKKAHTGKKLTDIIQKLPLKMAKIRHLEIGSKDKTKKVQEEETRESHPNRKHKVEYVVEESSEILEYAFDRNKTAYSCLLCGLHVKTITAHYKTDHPDSEVLISRLEKSEAEQAISDSKTFNYDVTALEQECSLEMIKKRVKHKLTGTATFFCRMCNYGNATNISQFYSHVSTHTGEYRYKCPVDGCDTAMASRDNVRSHVLSKHQNQKHLSNRVVELFPLPSEHGILFGYLCSRCNFVQVLKRNIESHIQRVHGGAEDVRGIKIDLSGKEHDGREYKKKRARRKKRSHEDEGECSGKWEDDDGGDDESDPGSEGSRSSDEEDIKPITNGEDDYQPMKTRSSEVDEEESPIRSEAGKTDDVTVKQEVLSEKEDEPDTYDMPLNVENKWTVGPLEATVSTSGTVNYSCNLGQCRYKTHLLTGIQGHMLSKHRSAVWTGVCESCKIPSRQRLKVHLPGVYGIADVLDHLEHHMKPFVYADRRKPVKPPKQPKKPKPVEKLQDVKKEVDPLELDEPKASESNNTKPEVRMPLLRVRSLVGDRLSTPKNSGEVATPTETPEKADSEPLCMIKDVRSLNPETEDASLEETTPQETVPESFPPNAEVVAGKPVLIRSCPSPKITISSETNPIPITVAQAKKALEVGQLVKVVPPPRVSEVSPMGINKLGFVAAASIRILSPGTFTTQAVIVPTFTTTSRVMPMSKTTDTTPSVTVTQRRISGPKPVCRNAVTDVVVEKVEGEGSEGKSPRKSPKLVDASPGIQGKREQQYWVPFSGKNIKDAKIYSQMLTKSKLCQLFKCMAVECSFTCNNETVFTQHIGLHEAQQRIKGKEKPLNKVRKIYNWQQCPYCCEVLVHTGSALTQHILNDHGHCLYQCAYCFYRAVSPTYVDLHQNAVHESTIKVKKKVIYKCKPVPGAVMSKQFDKQIKSQHIRPYQCEHCGRKFLIIQHFLDHMNKKHQSVTAHTCHICKILCFKADRLIAHYKLHSYSVYQCAYCLHGTENQKEMLYHLWNFHFTQPPVIYGRILEDQTKSKNVALDDLKLITIDNELSDIENHLEEAGSEAEQEPEKKDGEQVPISVDLSAIVSELGIDVDDAKQGTSEEVRSEIPAGVSVEEMLPNAQFSSEADVGKDDSTLVITSEDDKDVSVPIGQLPIEVLVNSDKEKEPEEKEKESVDKIIMNLQQKSSSVTVSPVVEGKAVEEAKPMRSVHKLPPTVPVNRSIITRVYQPKKTAVVKDGQVKDTAPLLFHQLCTTQRILPDGVQPQNVILAVPVVDTVKAPCNNPVKDEGSTNQNVLTLKRVGEESPDSAKKDGGILKRLCLGSPTTPAMITINTIQETPIRIADVRSLSNEETPLQPPIIRVEDFVEKKGESEEGEKKPEEKSLEPPSSPEVIILEPEEDGKETRSELVEVVDSEDDTDVKNKAKEEDTKKVMTDNDLEIRKQMEQLRNQMENETDCLLLDDDTTQNGGLEDFATEDTNQGMNDVESNSLDSQQASEESSDKAVRCEANTQDGDSRTNDSEDSKSGRTDDGKTGQPEMKEELSGKELYLCGNGNCNFAAENSTELKDHLYICDFSRESTVLMCPHCSKNFRHSAPYIEHLKRHGEKKYSCGLCGFGTPVESSMTQHMKRKHRCSQLKTLPHDTKPGHSVMYPKNYKKDKQDGEVHVYSPGDEDKLPLQSIYQENVNCAKCPYFTKVRSNMVRHLKIHIKSVETEGSIVVPSTAPTNPVPCLDTKERMFDKMTNLAASSQMAQANKVETLSPEEEAKLPQYVPEQMRHKCCSPDCNYLTIDDNMLKHHIKALHDEINVYSCPHCRETVHLEFRYVPLDKIGQHLKYHDSRLYKCYHCTYFHHQRYVVEKHALEKHPERRFSVFTVREPKAESTSAAGEEKKQEQQHRPASSEPVTKLWRCGLCEKFESTVRMTVLEHLAKVHNMKSKFKCKYCGTKSSQYSAFAAHFASKHNGQKVECVRALILVNKPSAEGQSVASHETRSEHFDTTPLWQRDAPRIRHIRGILIEEEEIKTKKTKKISSDVENEVNVPATHPPDMFYCPLCTDKKKVFRSKSSETFRNHLYQELNYQQFACILCGKMFVDKKECEKHHLRAHPQRTLSIKQTKEDSEIKFWVDKVVAKQQSQITERKRRMSAGDGDGQPAKKKKPPCDPGPAPAPSPKKKPETNRLTRSSSAVELKRDGESTAKRRSSDDKPEFTRNTRSGNAAHEPQKKCPHCAYKTNNLDSLKNHIKLRHLKTGKWLCPYCGESFELEKHATKHCRSSHPDEVPKAAPNPDEQVEELKDDFWMVEYGFGRDTQGKTEGEEPTERSNTKPEAITKSKNSNVYSCGYCMTEVTDQTSIVQHFETYHKNMHSDAHVGVVGTVYYQCNVCAEKLIDFESLNDHAKERHPNITLQFEIRKVYKYDSKDTPCAKCSKKPCECVKTDQTAADKAKDGCYRCPKCPVISTSYLDCIDHFNEHYPRYTCGNCSSRFFTETEIDKHQSEQKHKTPYTMTIPSENMLEEYKSGVKVKRNGIWQPLQSIKRSNSTEDVQETKKVKGSTARKSTTHVPERRTDSLNEVKIQKDAITPPHSDVHMYFFKDEF